ncbi:flagellinolysin [Sporomusa aerivorans]|uniref:flagellinolysin n=1 Tax=Sporomusa aerivorans TaxID=204936 RepID=UPI00352A526A
MLLSLRLNAGFLSTSSKENNINDIETQTATRELCIENNASKANFGENVVVLDLSERASKLSNKPVIALANSGTGSMTILKTATDSLNTIQSLLQYAKKLAKQAIQTENSSDRQALQTELTSVAQKIDEVSKSAKYQNINLFADSNELSANDKKIIQCLKSGWLEEAEKVVADRYGLSADGAKLRLVLDETPQDYLAAIEYHYGPDGKATGQILRIAVDTALPASLPDGGRKPYYDDRVLVHEMVHAIMGRTMNFTSLPNWFKEGTAEFIHGANERVATDLARNGGGIEGATAIQNALGNGTDETWVGSSLQYSSSAMAVRYLHEQIQAAGYSGGIKDLMTDLKNNPTENLDQALSHVSNYANTQEFVADFVTKGNGAVFIHKIEQSCEFTKTLLGGDTGGIGGAFVDGGPVQTAESVVPDIYYPSEQPLKHFNIIWPAQDSQAKTSITLASTRNGTLSYSRFKIDGNILNLNKVDLVNAPETAMDILNNAASYVSKGEIYLNSLLGTMQNIAAAEILSTIKNNTAGSSQLLAMRSMQNPTRVLYLLGDNYLLQDG